MSRRRGFELQTVLDAIKGSGGIVLTIADRLGCAWHTAQVYINYWEATKAAFADETETHLDRAESLVFRNIDLALAIQQRDKVLVDTSDAKWLLSRKGKSRGYADKIEQEMSGTNTIVIRGIDPDGD